jgi:hypothetical protein
MSCLGANAAGFREMDLSEVLLPRVLSYDLGEREREQSKRLNCVGVESLGSQTCRYLKPRNDD